MDASGVFFTSYGGDRALVRTRLQRIALVLLLVALVLVPLVAPVRWVSVGYAMFTTMIAVIGLQICTGYAGQVNLGQSAFMGVGAYACALLIYRANLPVPLALLLGGLAAAAFGVLFGMTAARIKGFYLALTTIAAQALFHFLILNLPTSWLGGAGGLHLEKLTLLGGDLANDNAIYWLALATLVVMTAGAFGIVRSRHGRSFEAVRDDDVAAGMMGIHVAATKARAFLVGAFYAGVAGGLWAVALAPCVGGAVHAVQLDLDDRHGDRRRPGLHRRRDRRHRADPAGARGRGQPRAAAGRLHSRRRARHRLRQHERAAGHRDRALSSVRTQGPDAPRGDLQAVIPALALSALTFNQGDKR